MCERCGYCIEGLPAAGNCPECARPIATSLPSTRPGTPWQRSPGFVAWARTNVLMLRRPGPTLRAMAIERGRARMLRRLNIAAAAAIFTLAPALLAGVQLLRREAPYVLADLTWPWAEASVRWLLVLGTVLGLWLCAAVTLSMLTTIEAWGIRTFGRVHRSRITPTVAGAITAHATAGWLAGSVLAAAGFAAGLALYEHAMHHNVGALRGLCMLSPALLPLVAAMIGLLWFESVVYVGVAGCRFANRDRSGAAPVALRGVTDGPGGGADGAAGSAPAGAPSS